MNAPSLPRLAMVLGDPAGIGPELIARLLADTEVREKAHIVLIADEAEMRRGMRIAGCEFPYRRIDALETLDFADATPLLHPWLSQGGDEFPRSEASAVGGRYSLETLALALELTRSGRTDAILFGPLNKTSLHMAGMDHSDELHWFAERLGFGGPFCEFNVLDDLWTSRVTSHVALAEVPGLLSQERVGEAIRLIDDALRRSGLARPRIGVCGLNPHNGDNGSFGREELDIIAPAVQKAREQGIAADGPYPADTAGRRPCLRRGGDHVPRPGADRDQADGLLPRRDRPGRPADPHRYAGPRYRLRYRRAGKGRRRRHPPGVRDRLPDGQAQSLIACMRRDNQSAAPS